MENINNYNFKLESSPKNTEFKSFEDKTSATQSSFQTSECQSKVPKKAKFQLSYSVNPTNTLKVPSSRDEVYQEYLDAYKKINQLIEDLYFQISSLSNDEQDLKADLLDRIQRLEILKGYGNDELASLFLTYQLAYTGKMSFSDFESLKEQILQLASMIASGQNTKNPIEKDKAEAQTIIDSLKMMIESLNEQIQLINQRLKEFEEKLKSFEKHPNIDEEISKKLEILRDQIAHFKAKLTAVMAEQAVLNQKISSSIELLNQLFALSNDDSNLEIADGLLKQIQVLKDALIQDSNAALNLLPTTKDLADLQKIVREIDNNLNPKPVDQPKIENGVWYIDWTSWDFPVPEGVDTVNIFVGQIIEKDGKPTIDGFGNLSQDPKKLQAFIDACHAKGIAVKVSIGGGGGSYDRCWDRLTPDNVTAYASGMVDFCHQYGIEGVDFDYEEFLSKEQEFLVGRLIKEFKQLDPHLSTSICTNAGFDTWKQIVQNICDGALDSDGHCMIDRIYIMSYYDPIENEKAWVLQWANWLKEKYNFEPAQVTVGLDRFDASAYSIEEFAKWAYEQGFSTCYWAFNPTQASIANQDENTIWDIYHPKLKAPADLLISPEFRG